MRGGVLALMVAAGLGGCIEVMTPEDPCAGDQRLGEPLEPWPALGGAPLDVANTLADAVGYGRPFTQTPRSHANYYGDSYAWYHEGLHVTVSYKGGGFSSAHLSGITASMSQPAELVPSLQGIVAAIGGPPGHTRAAAHGAWAAEFTQRFSGTSFGDPVLTLRYDPTSQQAWLVVDRTFQPTGRAINQATANATADALLPCFRDGVWERTYTRAMIDEDDRLTWSIVYYDAGAAPCVPDDALYILIDGKTGALKQSDYRMTCILD